VTSEVQVLAVSPLSLPCNSPSTSDTKKASKGSSHGLTTARQVAKLSSSYKSGRKSFRFLCNNFASELKGGQAIDDFLKGFWTEYERESRNLSYNVKNEITRGEEKASSFRANLVLRDFAIRRECAERYHRLEYVAKQLAKTQSDSPNKDVALLCHKLEELSLDDWECRSYGLQPDQMVQDSRTDEMTAEDDFFGEAELDEVSGDENADWVILNEDDGPYDNVWS
jgi:hypothetical protein